MLLLILCVYPLCFLLCVLLDISLVFVGFVPVFFGFFLLLFVLHVVLGFSHALFVLSLNVRCFLLLFCDLWFLLVCFFSLAFCVAPLVSLRCLCFVFILGVFLVSLDIFLFPWVSLFPALFVFSSCSYCSLLFSASLQTGSCWPRCWRMFALCSLLFWIVDFAPRQMGPP